MNVMSNDAYVFGNILERLHRWGRNILVALFMRFLFSHSIKSPRFYGLFHYHSPVNVPRMIGEVCTARCWTYSIPLSVWEAYGWMSRYSSQLALGGDTMVRGRGAACVKICVKASSLPYRPTVAQKTERKWECEEKGGQVNTLAVS